MSNYEVLAHGSQYKDVNTATIKNDTIVLKCTNCGCIIRTTDYETATQYNEVYYHFKCPECNCISNAERIYGI